MAVQKKKSDNKMLVIVCAILVLSLMVLGFKYAALRAGWRSYSGEAQESILGFHKRSAENQARVVGMGGMYRMNGREMYKNPKELQNYVATIGIGLKRDIVVVDRNSTIIADTTAANVSKKYTEDKGGEVQKTIADGVTRTFTETSVDFPKGIGQTVIALKDMAGNTIGAIIFSTEEI